jgi:hypothetical protein
MARYEFAIVVIAGLAAYCEVEYFTCSCCAVFRISTLNMHENFISLDHTCGVWSNDFVAFLLVTIINFVSLYSQSI